MTRITPFATDEVDPSLQEAMAKQRRSLGLVPESLLTMAHRPEIASAWASLASAIAGPGTVDGGLKQLVAYVASATHGCRYCQAHTAHSAERLGVDPDKLYHAFEYDTSDLFSEAERAALSMAHAGALVPNEATDEHFARMKASFTDEQIVEIVAMIAMFGYLNRWNDTMATTLEDEPRTWATDHLAPNTGWAVNAG